MMQRIAVLGEDESDAKTVQVLSRRILGNAKARFTTQGFGGIGDLLNKAGRMVVAKQKLGFNRFIVCVDADTERPDVRQQKTRSRLKELGLDDKRLCIVVPVRCIESWILADEKAFCRFFKISICKSCSEPERLEDPRGHLRGLSRDSGQKPRYVHTIHNEHIANDLDLEILKKKCPSFLTLVNFLAPQAAKNR